MAEQMQGPKGGVGHGQSLLAMCRSLAEGSPHPVVAVERITRIVPYVNPAFCALVGKEAGDLIGKSFDGFVPRDVSRRTLAAIDRVLATGAPERVQSEERDPGIAEASTPCWSLSIWAILGDSAEPVGAMIQVVDLTDAVAFLHDSAAINEALLLSALREYDSRGEAESSVARLSGEIAESKESNEALRKIAALLETRIAERTGELQRANRDLQGFMYSIAHNLRAPLRAIVSTSSILVEEAEESLSDPHLELLMRQKQSALRVSSLIDDLLEYARMFHQPTARRSVDLSAIANELAERLPATFLDRLLNVAVEEDILADADGEKLTLILYYLLDNAAKFSPRGGKISVGRQAGYGGAFYVRDEGIGFNMAYGSKLFQPFERLVGEEEYPGNGIGLAKARKLIELHGGTIWADSHLGKGTTFFFTL